MATIVCAQCRACIECPSFEECPLACPMCGGSPKLGAEDTVVAVSSPPVAPTYVLLVDPDALETVDLTLANFFRDELRGYVAHLRQQGLQDIQITTLYHQALSNTEG